MRQVMGLAVGAAIAALVLGCSPGKELPETSLVKKETETVPQDPFGKVPKESDPEAKKVADRVIKAISQGQPERLTKTRVSRAVAKGKFTYPEGFTGTAERFTTNADRVVETEWPGHARVSYKYEQGPVRSRIFGLNQPFGWVVAGDGPGTPTPLPPALSQRLVNGLLAEQWLPAGIALVDPKAVFFDPGARKTEEGSVTTVKFGLDDEHPIYLITVDDKTDLIRRIESAPLEDNKRVRKITLFKKHQAYGDLMLPAEMENSERDEKVEVWSVTAWEFPEKFESDLFNPPRK